MNWKGKKVLVIGDVMLDKYLFGKVERVSPEAPVPVVAVERERYVPGGAANAANNVACLGGDAVLVGIVGNDLAKEILADEVKKRGIHARFIVDPSSPTIQKIRVLNGSQQVARIDYEDTAYADEREVEAMVEHIMRQEVDAILVSDYAKGTITQALLLDIKALAKKKGIPLLIDPKPKHKLWYIGCTLITPNKKEAEEMVGYQLSSKEEIERAGKALTQELDCHVLLTLGEKGMSLFEKGKPALHIPTVAQKVYDVSGAGDTVIATLALALASGMPLNQAAALANQAAGIKVGKVGTAPVAYEELKEHASHLS